MTHYKEFTEKEYSTFDTLRKELFNNKQSYIWPHNISQMRKFISEMEAKYKNQIPLRIVRMFIDCNSCMSEYEEILNEKYDIHPNGAMINKTIKELVTA